MKRVYCPKCPKHPKYKGVHVPRAKCSACWRWWMHVQDVKWGRWLWAYCVSERRESDARLRSLKERGERRNVQRTLRGEA